jgi:enediyne biosynthesis protein E4
MNVRLLLMLLLICAVACNRPAKLFEALDSKQTGIEFINTITEDKEHNVFTYQYYYNGNGVAVGDVNNDGLADLFFTGNQIPSKLYLNKGNFQFEDITATAAVAGKNAWRTGATMVDINADGLLDIYVCYSGFGSEQDRANQLFINTGIAQNGVPVFSEKAAEYGIDAPGTYTSQSAFLDFDQDGDLDMFLLNHANEFYSPFFNTRKLRNLRHPQYGNRLYRNDSSRFVDISEQAGIYGSGINFGLGIAVSDINSDGWPDILVSNDFHEQDYFYLNNRNGTFREVCQQVFAHMSRNTMGLDIADFNNDLLPDVVTLDMLPESNYRQKILQGADEYDKYNLMVDSGYGHQNNRNMLQLHSGFTKDSMPVFAEIGQLAGISNTDWSWAALFADFDNDGWKDLLVTNGYLRESTNLDFMKYQVAEAMKQAMEQGLDIHTPEGYAKNMPLYDLVKNMPSTKLSSYVFRNKGNLSFSNESANWGIDEKSVSSGAAYVDLDNDGALDLVVCRNNDPVKIYRNTQQEIEKRNFIKIKLQGDAKNISALGAKVIVTTDSGTQMQEMYPVRGYQSSVDQVLHFGIGSSKNIRQVEVIWSSNRNTIITNPAINSTVVIKKTETPSFTKTATAVPALFADISAASGIDFRHRENIYVDFKREMLVPYELSRQGPKMSKADVNNDGLDDFFVGGAAGQSGALYLQDSEGRFYKSPSQPWQEDATSEDIGITFFDADNDKDADLYIASGGAEWLIPGAELQDRLYINDGKGNFSRANGALPEEVFNGSCVTAADFDNDGDNDLFVGAGSVPGRYPMNAGNLVLRNDFDKTSQTPRFTDITKSIAGDILWKAGMVNDGSWIDIDKDGWKDLVIAGDWMPVMIFKNEKGKKLTDITQQSGLDRSNGLWKKILPADVDNDGDIDFIAGNLGNNTQFKTSPQQPLVTYAVENNLTGRVTPVMTWHVMDSCRPFNSRDELVEQMPILNKKYLRYAEYATATLEDLLTAEQIRNSQRYYIHNTQTAILINNNGRFQLQALPVEAQFSVVNSILYNDFDGDNVNDILLAGNFFPFRVQQGRCDAGLGLLLKGNGRGQFTVINRAQTGLFIAGDVRDMIDLKGRNGRALAIAKNSDAIQLLKHN